MGPVLMKSVFDTKNVGAPPLTEIDKIESACADVVRLNARNAAANATKRVILIDGSSLLGLIFAIAAAAQESVRSPDGAVTILLSNWISWVYRQNRDLFKMSQFETCK
jgi:hypothetical protein